jgi:hypothetical protein
LVLGGDVEVGTLENGEEGDQNVTEELQNHDPRDGDAAGEAFSVGSGDVGNPDASSAMEPDGESDSVVPLGLSRTRTLRKVDDEIEEEAPMGLARTRTRRVGMGEDGMGDAGDDDGDLDGVSVGR